MASKPLNRLIRNRLHRAVIWAMVPLAAVGGRSLSGCMSPTGQVALNCRCSESMGSGKVAADSAACQCHCSCCQGKTCCCKQGAKSCCASATKDNPSRHDGLQGEGHCRQVRVFAATSAVKAEFQKASTQDVSLLPVVVDAAAVESRANHLQVAQFDTGPPPDSLVVTLHRWLI
jgi:hypothetical protein